MKSFFSGKLIVGTIITIVLMFVIVSSFQRRAAESIRLNETRKLQQWGIALNLYLLENENQLPDVGRTPVSSDQSRAWFNALPPYISEEPLASLPHGKRPRPGIPSLWIRPSTKPVKIWDPEVFYFNYGMNRFLQPQEGARSFRIYEIDFPSSTIFLAPIADYTPAAEPENIVFLDEKKPEAFAQVLFCDGHVQPILKKELLNPNALLSKHGASGITWYQK